MLKKYLKILKEDKSGKSKSFYFKKSENFNVAFVKKFLNDYSKLKKVDARVCLHKNYQDTLQDMILIQHFQNFYPPHKHLNRFDTYQVIYGCLGVVIFDDFGNVNKIYKLTNNSLYKTPKNKYHMTLPITKKVIYHEYRSGTFNRKTNCIFPKWSPSNNNGKIKFKKKILKRLNEKS